MMPLEAELKAIWQAGVAAVTGERSVATALERDAPPKPDGILAVGKAAASMAKAVLAHYGSDIACLVCTKHHHSRDLPPGPVVIEAAHPIPDDDSLRAGARAVQFVENFRPGDHLIMLVSGGASSLVEYPRDGLTLADLVRENDRLLAEGHDIHAINQRRKTLSRIKGGQLLERFRGARVTVYAISDVEGDDIAVIGSGLGAAPEAPAFDYRLTLVATNALARAAAAREAARRGHAVLSCDETLYGDVTDAAHKISTQLDRTRGVRIWGGEPTVVLPRRPGTGGRNQALALLTAKRIVGRSDVAVIVGGTDGSDGPTDAAGGWVDGTTWTSEAQGFLDRADSGRYLQRGGHLLITGPTGTNVMDLAVSLCV